MLVIMLNDDIPPMPHFDYAPTDIPDYLVDLTEIPVESAKQTKYRGYYKWVEKHDPAG